MKRRRFSEEQVVPRLYQGHEGKTTLDMVNLEIRLYSSAFHSKLHSKLYLSPFYPGPLIVLGSVFGGRSLPRSRTPFGKHLAGEPPQFLDQKIQISDFIYDFPPGCA